MFERILQRYFTHDELGWKAYQEVFWRYNLYTGKKFNIYLHRIDAPVEPPACHSHPWWFFTIILRRGYLERVGDKQLRRRPGFMVYRRPEFSHVVSTPYGRSWSLVITGRWSQDWTVQDCR